MAREGNQGKYGFIQCLDGLASLHLFTLHIRLPTYKFLIYVRPPLFLSPAVTALGSRERRHIPIRPSRRRPRRRPHRSCPVHYHQLLPFGRCL